MADKHVWHIQVNEPSHVAAVSDAFLARLVSELENEQVTAIILKGSYARGEGTVYSDIDLTVFVCSEPDQTHHRSFYRDGRLINIEIHTIESYRKLFLLPQWAIFAVPSTREACILLDKDGAFKRLQQEAKEWTWEPLQDAANCYACETLLRQAENTHKALRAFLVQDALALAEMTLRIFYAITGAIIVQRGILSRSGNSYFRQVQESVGIDSAWTLYHRLIVGIEMDSTSDHLTEMRGIAALRLYQETANILRTVLLASQQGDVVEQTVTVIEEALAGKHIT